MKKILSILLIVIAAFIGAVWLVACDENETQAKNETQSLEEIDERYIYTWTDSETGVSYIIVYRAGSWGVALDITPRLNADGTPYVVTKGGTNNDGE